MGRVVVIDAEANSIPFLRGLETGTAPRSVVELERRGTGKLVYLGASMLLDNVSVVTRLDELSNAIQRAEEWRDQVSRSVPRSPCSAINPPAHDSDDARPWPAAQPGAERSTGLNHTQRTGGPVLAQEPHRADSARVTEPQQAGTRLVALRP